MNKAAFAVVNALYSQVFQAIDNAYVASLASTRTQALTYILQNTDSLIQPDSKTTDMVLFTEVIPSGRVHRNIHILASAITSGIMTNVYSAQANKSNIKDAIALALLPVYEVFKGGINDYFFQVDHHTDNERLGILIYTVTDEVLEAMKAARIVRMQQTREEGGVRTSFAFTGSFEDMVKSITLAGLVPILPMVAEPKP